MVSIFVPSKSSYAQARLGRLAIARIEHYTTTIEYALPILPNIASLTETRSLFVVTPHILNWVSHILTVVYTPSEISIECLVTTTTTNIGIALRTTNAWLLTQLPELACGARAPYWECLTCACELDLRYFYCLPQIS